MLLIIDICSSRPFSGISNMALRLSGQTSIVIVFSLYQSLLRIETKETLELYNSEMKASQSLLEYIDVLHVAYSWLARDVMKF